nr:hypothetical protein [Methylomarinum sp. Ch1-1]MDP4521407.1 hypothetical protein [Methylomarinum sp. Ch1-1]
MTFMTIKTINRRTESSRVTLTAGSAPDAEMRFSLFSTSDETTVGRIKRSGSAEKATNFLILMTFMVIKTINRRTESSRVC